MPSISSIRVSEKNRKKLWKILGEMQSNSDERITMDKVVEALLKKWEKNHGRK